MLTKLRKLDLAIILSAAAAVVAYFFLQAGTFQFFLWLTAILGLVRLLGIIRRRLLWKIRNRLIISSLFFIVTPIVLITVFFYLIINIIIYQYNTAIFDNMMINEIRTFQESGDYYLGLADEARITLEVQRFKSRKPPFLNLAFFKEAAGRYQAFFAYPEGLPLDRFDVNGPLSQFQSGYFKIGGALYHGVLQRRNGFAALIFETLNQEFFDAMPRIGDFKVLFMGSGGNSVSASSQEISVRLNDKDFDGFEKYHFPFPFTFRFWDFDEIKAGRPALKFNMFLLINDYSKILQKLRTSDRAGILRDQARALEREIIRGGDQAALMSKSQKLDELKKELEVLQKSDNQSSVFPSRCWCASCSVCSGFSSSSPFSSAGAWCGSSPAPSTS